MYIDTHTHISFNEGVNPDDYIMESKEVGVNYFVSCGYSVDTIKESIELASKYEEIFLALGYHPSEADNIVENDLLDLENLLKSNDRIVAIGEIGLDFHYYKDNIEKQITLFKKQLFLAEKYKKPVVIHTREAINLTYDILSEYPNVRGVIHCFSSSYEMARKFIDIGYKLGIGGVLTFKNSSLVDVVKKIDISNIVLETDSPYLTPHPYRKRINSSKYIPVISEKISEIKEIPIIDVMNNTTKNAIDLFDLSI